MKCVLITLEAHHSILPHVESAWQCIKKDQAVDKLIKAYKDKNCEEESTNMLITHTSVEEWNGTSDNSYMWYIIGGSVLLLFVIAFVLLKRFG